MNINVTIKDMSKVNEYYTVVLELTLNGENICISIDNISKHVSKAEAILKNNILYINLLDENGRGFASCIIDVSHLQKKCFKCKSLLIPSH